MNIQLPKIVFGTSSLGNIYEIVPFERKREIVENWLKYQEVAVVDSAGKYGAGLSLECIGKALEELCADPARVIISNKLAWKRVPLTGPEPTFEKGVWKGLEYDAVQRMGYEGILECYEQGESLLGNYSSQLVSVHDPDEYLAEATSEEEAAEKYQDIMESYRALVELREAGKVLGVGVGSKDWTVIKRLFDDGVSLDWVMFANSYSLHDHPKDLMEFMGELNAAGVVIINSAVFNGGFLIGSDWYNYKPVNREDHAELYGWRDSFYSICEQFDIKPALACCQFGMSVPGIAALALSSTKPARVASNVEMVEQTVPAEFWAAIKEAGLLEADYPHL